MIPTLDDIRSQVDELAAKIDAPENLLPTYGHSRDFAFPHIEVNNNGQLYFVVVERGEELERYAAVDPDDLLFKIFSGITHSMASKMAAQHNIQAEDFRRQLFTIQANLLSTLSTSWKLRLLDQIHIILKARPFDDNANIRAEYSAGLTRKGTPAPEAWIEACRKYPLPTNTEK